MFKKHAVKLGIAPIGWTNDDMPELGAENTFEQCISEMALAGFTGTEIGNKFPRDIKKLRKALELRNMEIASAWFSTFLTTKPYKETEQSFIEHRDFLHGLGAKVIVISEQGHSIQGQKETPVFAGKPYFTTAEWEKLALGLNKLGKCAQEKGMQIVYHHHMGTGIQTTEEINRLMEMTDEDVVFLLYDTGHLYFSGEDLIEVLENHLPRIKHIHLKDVRSQVAEEVNQDKLSFLEGVRKGVFTVPGDGDIDFKGILTILSQANYEGWFIVEAEQDPSKANPFEYALIARDYIKKITGI